MSSTNFWHVLLSLALMTATAYGERVALDEPVSRGTPTSSSSSSSSSFSSPAAAAAAAGKAGAVSDERQNFERYLLEQVKKRIVWGLRLNVSEDGAVLRSNRTLPGKPRPSAPPGSDAVSSGTPVNISIDGRRGEKMTIAVCSRPCRRRSLRPFVC